MKRYNNKMLAFILVGLIALFSVTKIVRLRNNATNLHALLLQVDTSQIATIKLYPYSDQHKEVVLSRKNNTWMVSDGSGVEDIADTGMMRDLLEVLPHLYADRIMTKRKDQWAEYKMNDTSATRVLVLDAKNKPITDYYVHKGIPRGELLPEGTYIRLSGDDNVYMIKGYYYTVPDRPFVKWREKTILKIDTNQITSITFPGFDTHTLVKRGAVWMIDGKQADSANRVEIKRYLDNIRFMYSWSFDDQFHPSGPSNAQLKIDGANGQLALVNAWKKNDSTWVLNSSQRPGGYYTMTDSALRKDFWLPIR